MPFADFPTLVMNTAKGQDWDLVVRQPGAPIAIITIHGGGIEPLTSELAAAIAATDYNLYDLRGLRATGNAELRVPVIRFQEMRLQMLLDSCQTALHLDGIGGDEPLLTLGGRNTILVDHLERALKAAGFRVEPPPSPMLVQSRQRFYNQSELGGAQIELSYGLRQSMVTAPLREGADWQDEGQHTPALQAFVEATRNALRESLAAMRSDLDLTMRRFEQATKDFPAHLRAGAGHQHPHASSDKESG
jgi:phage replication-related protein YjqB (UPF0714/DUF867 family)